MSINFFQNDFKSGELSPEVWARNDRPFYKSGLEICKNFTPLLTGGVRFRPGTGYSVHTRLNHDAFALPFRFNIDQAYSLEFTEYKLRIHRNGGALLETAQNIEDLVVATGVITITSHGLSSGDEVYIDSIVGPNILNKQFYLVVWIDADTFSLTDVDGNAIDTTEMDVYVSGGTVARVYEITSPYTVAEAKRIKYCGTADLMYLFHPDHEPRVLIRSGATSWAINTYTRYSAQWKITAITNANPGVVTTETAHGLVAGDRVYIAQVIGMTEVNKTEFLVGTVAAKTFQLKTLAGANVNTTNYGDWVEGGKVAQVRDVGLNITGISKATAGVVTIAGHGYATYDKIYIAGVVGMTEVNGLFFWVEKIDANTFYLTNELGTRLDTSGYTAWSSGGTSQYIHGLFTKIGDFPTAGGFYGGRMAIGGPDNDPDTFWLSRGPDSETGESEFDDFSIGTEDTDGCIFLIPALNFQAHRILWFSGVPNFMVVGTSSGVYKANGGSDGAAITPTNIAVTPMSSVGVADMMPVVVNNLTYYVEQGGLTLRAFGYSLIEDSYKAYDKSLLSDEITQGGIVQLAYAKGRPEIIYLVRADGVLLSCTILESDDVAGWGRIHIGGEGVVLSVVTEPRSSGFDRVGVLVERTINSATRRYIEYLTEDPVIPDISDEFTDIDSKDADKARYEKRVFEVQKQFVRLDSSLVRDTTQDIVLTLGAKTGASVTATAASSAFKATHVGQYIFAKFLTGDETGIAEIIGYTSETVVTVKIKEDFDALIYAAGAWYLTDQTITGLEHLEGETVGVVTDGAVHGDLVVEDGAITLEYPARYSIIGKRYIGLGRTLDAEIAGIPGTAIGRRKTVEAMFVKLRHTMGGRFGTQGFYEAQGAELLFRREGNSFYDRPPVLYSGLKEIPKMKDGYSNEKRFYFMQDQPLPMTVLAIVPSVDIGEEE
jgi:hypothetical protein